MLLCCTGVSISGQAASARTMPCPTRACAHSTSRWRFNPSLTRSTAAQGMLRRQGNYSTQKPIKVCVGTWNVNGGSQFKTIAFNVRSATMHARVTRARNAPWRTGCWSRWASTRRMCMPSASRRLTCSMHGV